jgi:hypothetical protein
MNDTNLLSMGGPKAKITMDLTYTPIGGKPLKVEATTEVDDTPDVAQEDTKESTE